MMHPTRHGPEIQKSFYRDTAKTDIIAICSVGNRLAQMTKILAVACALLCFAGVLLAAGASSSGRSSGSSKGGRQQGKKKDAVVTLVAGDMSGYEGGAVALGQSLIDVGSELHRVILVTPEVDSQRRAMFDHLWEVIEVENIPCNHKLGPSVTSKTHDLNGAGYQAGLKRFRPTCTKFAAWSLTQFNRVLFLDVDTLVVGPIDDILYGFSNASFAAAPDVFPPDNFNSGVLVLNPSMETFQRILKANEEVGSAEGGDQGVLNNGFCPQWNAVAGGSDPDCGRIPWIFNVQAAHYETYKTLRQMSNLREPAIVHFVSDGKPWRVLAMDYQQIPFTDENIRKLSEQRVAHLLWRQAFFSGTKETNIAPPAHSVLFEGQQGASSSRSSKSPKKGGLPTEMTLDESGGAQTTFRKSQARVEKEAAAARQRRDEEMDDEEEVEREERVKSKKSSSRKTKKPKGAKKSSSSKKKSNKKSKR